MHDKLFTSFGVIGHQHGKCLFLLLFGKGRGQRFRAVYVKTPSDSPNSRLAHCLSFSIICSELNIFIKPFLY